MISVFSVSPARSIASQNAGELVVYELDHGVVPGLFDFCASISSGVDGVDWKSTPAAVNRDWLGKSDSRNRGSGIVFRRRTAPDTIGAG